MSFLDSLNPTDRSIVDQYLHPLRFLKDDLILRQGDPGDGCYLIDEGEVRLELEDTETDSDRVLGYVHPGMFLGEFSLLDGEPRSAYAFAHTDVMVRWFSKTDYESLCKEYPQVGIAISNALGRNLTEKLRHYTDRMAEYLFAEDSDASTNEMIESAAEAQKTFQGCSEEKVDALLYDLANAVAEQAQELAQACVEETKIGVVEDKVTKIKMASLGVYQILAGQPATGKLNVDLERRITELAAPMGVVLGLIPLTNPVSTIIFKTLICLKSRNALIYSCHHSALGVGNRTGEIIQKVLLQHTVSENLVQWIRERTSRRRTMMFMKHKGIDFILATGGPSLVHAAYSSGTPAIGVGAGNAPVWVCADADPEVVAEMVIASKSFDNGVICASENNLVVDSPLLEVFTQSLMTHGAAVLSQEEKSSFMSQAFDAHGCLDKTMIGQSAQSIALRTRIQRSFPIRLIVIPAELEEINGPLGKEKLAPILSMFHVNDETEGLRICKLILDKDGRGHTAAIHTNDMARIERFGQEMEVSRILVNVSTTLGSLGVGTGLLPSLTLGCGTFGKNSTTDNVTYRHLLNIKYLAMRKES
jgi:acyl-CoA reductase-like NAD-dependent aldehyde dehydrogenase